MCNLHRSRPWFWHRTISLLTVLSLLLTSNLALAKATPAAPPTEDQRLIIKEASELLYDDQGNPLPLNQILEKLLDGKLPPEPPQPSTTFQNALTSIETSLKFLDKLDEKLASSNLHEVNAAVQEFNRAHEAYARIAALQDQQTVAELLQALFNSRDAHNDLAMGVQYFRLEKENELADSAENLQKLSEEERQQRISAIIDVKAKESEGFITDHNRPLISQLFEKAQDVPPYSDRVTRAIENRLTIEQMKSALAFEQIKAALRWYAPRPGDATYVEGSPWLKSTDDPTSITLKIADKDPAALNKTAVYDYLRNLFDSLFPDQDLPGTMPGMTRSIPEQTFTQHALQGLMALAEQSQSAGFTLEIVKDKLFERHVKLDIYRKKLLINYLFLLKMRQNLGHGQIHACLDTISNVDDLIENLGTEKAELIKSMLSTEITFRPATGMHLASSLRRRIGTGNLSIRNALTTAELERPDRHYTTIEKHHKPILDYVIGHNKILNDLTDLPRLVTEIDELQAKFNAAPKRTPAEREARKAIKKALDFRKKLLEMRINELLSNWVSIIDSSAQTLLDLQAIQTRLASNDLTTLDAPRSGLAIRDGVLTVTFSDRYLGDLGHYDITIPARDADMLQRSIVFADQLTSSFLQEMYGLYDLMAKIADRTTSHADLISLSEQAAQRLAGNESAEAAEVSLSKQLTNITQRVVRANNPVTLRRTAINADAATLAHNLAFKDRSHGVLICHNIWEVRDMHASTSTSGRSSTACRRATRAIVAIAAAAGTFEVLQQAPSSSI